MQARITHSLVGLILGGAALSCASQASTICGLECDCEHCSDIKEDVTCRGRERDADVADAYGCRSQWDAWATCYEDKGSCNDTDARYSTVTQTSSGTCSNEMNLGMPCPMGNADCATLGPNAYCSAGTCRQKTCTGTGVPCTTNSQCPAGPGKDLCQSQADALQKCEAAATAHKQQTQPPGGA